MQTRSSYQPSLWDNPFEVCSLKRVDLDHNTLGKKVSLLNKDLSHFTSRDDICTPLNCVKTMLDYLPKPFWQQSNLKILDPCCGNGNFGVYGSTLTNPNNIYYNEINETRYNNCKELLKPAHIRLGDALTLPNNAEYDLVMANPPYRGGGNKNRGLSNLFIEKSIDLLKPQGYLCFITPNNFMTYNNHNSTLAKLLKEGSFLVIDNRAKQYFPSVGSSFTIFVWQKWVFNHTTTVYNNYLFNDMQRVNIPKTAKFLPLYLSNLVFSIIEKGLATERNNFNYRCDLHNHTQKEKLNDEKTEEFCYPTIHTARKTRYASIKQDIYDQWIIVVPLSTYYIPYIEHNKNTTQSVGYFAFETEEEAKAFLPLATSNYIKFLIHITRYGNFQNLKLLKHLKFDFSIAFTEEEQELIKQAVEKLKY